MFTSFNSVVGFDIVYVMPPAANADVTEVAIIDRTNNPETIRHPEKKDGVIPVLDTGIQDTTLVINI
ncbi:MAG: hypothetical protein LBU56_05150 [Rickettsiales bacterium]|jgi:hypothetical protein|nr:hypothetical protein [Rickettsiales bacterium]